MPLADPSSGGDGSAFGMISKSFLVARLALVGYRLGESLNALLQ